MLVVTLRSRPLGTMIPHQTQPIEADEDMQPYVEMLLEEMAGPPPAPPQQQQQQYGQYGQH
ncbi:hypothetical protein E4U13_002297 [Claviceps humidiphila]|uniref:Uncharacterized protein n=1 Tax=Claviceps humidiphila TaxID=1294629 RepID=A0A9P7TV19_9HYPO|nr:hypothetical protein E4U13_002297 [Claviceps humidiphila]